MDNSLPNDNILDKTKFKAVVDNNFNVSKIITFVFVLIENIVGKGENAGYQLFLLFPQCFQKFSFSESLKVRIVRKRVNRPLSLGLQLKAFEN